MIRQGRWRIASLTLLVAMLGCGGCAVFSPYVEVPPPPHPEKPGTDLCATEPFYRDNEGLNYACRAKQQVAKYRRWHTYGRTGLAGILIPAAAVVGYRSARDLSTASTTAIATGGLAAYGLGQYVLFPGATDLYTKAEQCLQCAIDVHSNMMMLAAKSNAVLRDYFIARREYWDSLGTNKPDPLAAILDKRVRVAAGFDHTDRSLVRATERILAGLNGAIDRSQRPLIEVGSQIGSLGLSTSADGGDKKPLAAPPESDPLLANFIKAANSVLSSGAQIEPLDSHYQSCAFTASVAAPPPIEMPMRLGVSRLTVGASDKQTVNITGGRAPFAVYSIEGDSKVTAQPRTSGAIHFVEVVTDAAGARTYEFIISDALGAQQAFDVTVTSGATP